MTDIKKMIAEEKTRLSNIRQTLHKIPEPGLKEIKSKRLGNRIF